MPSPEKVLPMKQANTFLHGSLIGGAIFPIDGSSSWLITDAQDANLVLRVQLAAALPTCGERFFDYA